VPDDLLVLGMNHRTSPVELRERLAVSGEQLLGRVSDLARGADLPEALLLSTCNRVEIYVSDDDPVAAAVRVRRWLDAHAGENVGDYIYERRGPEAVRHAFRVAASLDSMVIGEPQILGQVKEAYAASKASGTVGAMLDRTFSHALQVAKRVRNETAVAAGSVSISSVASDLAVKIFGELHDRRVLLVGAGEMGEAAAKHLRKHGASLFILNRSRQKAERVASECGGQPRRLEELSVELSKADVAIASTSSPHFVITTELMRGVMRARRNRPLFLIDIAVPRDVDPACADLDNLFVFDVDDLEKVAEENLSQRRREAARAEGIVGQEVEAFERWRQSNQLKPTIVGLRSHVRGVLQAELERTLPRLGELSPKARKSLDKMVDAMTNKVLHEPMTRLKAQAGSRDGTVLVAATKHLFALEEAPRAKAPSTHDATTERAAGPPKAPVAARFEPLESKT
jgi:glutamyl-tRNA reductase